MLRPGLISRHGGQVVASGTPFQDALEALSPAYYWEDASAFPIANTGSAGSADLAAGGATANATGPLTTGDTKAFTTDGTDDAPTPGAINPNSSALSLVFWLDWDGSFAGGFNNDAAQILSYGNPAAAASAAFHVLANGPGTGIWRIDNYRCTFDFAPPSDGWRLWQIVMDHSAALSDSVKLWIDGTAVTPSATATQSHAANFSGQTFYLARRASGGWGPGKWAHPAIFTSALTGTDAANLWDAGT